jgi:hypothetical protein
VSRRLPVLLAAVACLVAAPAASAHQGSPDFLSVVRGVQPAVPGLSVVMLNRDDRLQVTNRGDETVEFKGYESEPYLRFLPNGRVQRNVYSPATYMNDERYGNVAVPAIADATKAPRWATVSEDGRFEFHDHRIHWMGTGTPPAVKDASRKTKVNDWIVPFTTGAGAAGAIHGTLWWTPSDDGGLPTGAIVALVVVVLLSVALVVVVRRRRRGSRDEGDGTEAW